MPKISNKNENIPVGNTWVYVDFQVWYNQKYGFHVPISGEHKEALKSLYEAEKDPYNIHVEYMKGTNIVDRFLVVGDSESKVTEIARRLLSHVLNAKIEERKVIVIMCMPENVNYGNMKYNAGHKLKGISLGLLYCTEKIIAGGKPKYFGDRNQDLQLWDRGTVVIDDTPAARAALEKIYGMLGTLTDKLQEYTKNSDKVAELVSGHLKLLK